MLRVIFFIFVFVGTASAAPDFEAFEQLRSDFRSQKTDIVLESMQLSPEQEKAFLPLYEEYNQKLMLLQDQRLVIVKRFASQYSEIDDAVAAELGKDSLKLAKELASIREQSYKKISKQVSPIIAVRFLQVDNQLATLANVIRMRAIPLIKTSEEVAVDFGMSVSAGVSDDVGSKMDAQTEDIMNKRIEEERAKKGM